jgi:hypothetical protein
MLKVLRRLPVFQATAKSKETTMNVETNLIAGIMLGFEYTGRLQEDDGYDHHFVFDIFFLRVLVLF